MSPHNTQTTFSEFSSPNGIDFAWESTVKLPESFGWTVDHILGMIAISNLNRQDIVPPLRQEFMTAFQNDPELLNSAYHKLLTEYILSQHLQDLLSRIPKSEDIKNLAILVRKTLRFHFEGAQVHSQEWKAINSKLRAATGRTLSMEKTDQRNCLECILRALTMAASDQTPTTYANIVREVANASICLGGDVTETYTMLAQKLIGAMKGANSKSTGSKNNPGKPLTRQAIKLLEKLGTFSPVKDHSI